MTTRRQRRKCRQKKRFGSKVEALRFKTTCNLPTQGQYAYKCRTCGHWHLGHKGGRGVKNALAVGRLMSKIRST